MSCHESNAPTILRFALITVSDTRKKATDVSGHHMANLITDKGHEITSHSIIPDEPTIIKEVIRAQSGSADVLCLSGGTGISRRDQTYEASQCTAGQNIAGLRRTFSHAILATGRQQGYALQSDCRDIRYRSRFCTSGLA